MLCAVTAVISLIALFIILNLQQSMILKKEGFVEYIVYGPGFWHRGPWWRRRHYGWGY